VLRAAAASALAIAAAGCGRVGYAQLFDAGRGELDAPVELDAGPRDGPMGDVGPVGPPIAMLRDDFEDGTSAPLWTTFAAPGTVVTETAGAVVMVPAAGEADAYSGYLAAQVYDLRGGAYFATIVEAPSASPNVSCYLRLEGAGAQISLTLVSGELRFEAGGVVRGSVPFDAPTHRAWRIEEAAGMLSFETSADTRSWTTHLTIPVPFAVTQVRPSIGAGTSGIEAVPGRCRVDDVNISR
jgi:hypothetical protein